MLASTPNLGRADQGGVSLPQPSGQHQRRDHYQYHGQQFPARWSAFTGTLVNNYQHTQPHA